MSSTIDLLCRLIDDCLCPGEISRLLDWAVKVCPAMKRNNAKIYPANIRNVFPGCSDEFANIATAFINAVASN